MDYNMIIGSVVKLFLALILGGLIGGERSNKSRPAGMRTHMLVCIGAALVQITSISYYEYFHPTMNVDPMRLGAQVVSGIGFLGAGTIMKEGVNIRGLTTAASIWVVGCLGLTIGAGLYAEAIGATLVLYIALKFFKRFEERLAKGKRVYGVEVIAENIPGKIGEIGVEIGKCGLSIINVDLRDGDRSHFVLELILKGETEIDYGLVLEKVTALKGIKEIKFL